MIKKVREKIKNWRRNSQLSQARLKNNKTNNNTNTIISPPILIGFEPFKVQNQSTPIKEQVPTIAAQFRQETSEQQQVQEQQNWQQQSNNKKGIASTAKTSTNTYRPPVPVVSIERS